jgi:hypothetical protein
MMKKAVKEAVGTLIEKQCADVLRTSPLEDRTSNMNKHNKIIKRIAPPLLIAPLFDSRMLSEFERKHRSYEEETRAVDRIVSKYLASRVVDFQRNDEAITV